MVRDLVSRNVGGALERARLNAHRAPGAAHHLGDVQSELSWGDGYDRRARSAECCAIRPGGACSVDNGVEARDKIPAERHVEHVVQRSGEKRTVAGRQPVDEGRT